MIAHNNYEPVNSSSEVELSDSSIGGKGSIDTSGSIAIGGYKSNFPSKFKGSKSARGSIGIGV